MQLSKTLATGTLAALTIAGAVAFVPGAVNAQTATTQTNGNAYGQHAGNGQNGSIEERAKALNLTADQLREKLQTKTMLEIAKDQGLSTEQYQAKMREVSAARWQARGLSDEEIKQRTQAQAERQADCDGTGDHQGQGGFGRNAKTE